MLTHLSPSVLQTNPCIFCNTLRWGWTGVGIGKLRVTESPRKHIWDVPKNTSVYITRLYTKRNVKIEIKWNSKISTIALVRYFYMADLHMLGYHSFKFLLEKLVICFTDHQRKCHIMTWNLWKNGSPWAEWARNIRRDEEQKGGHHPYGELQAKYSISIVPHVKHVYSLASLIFKI